jgi:hypothetical protein
MSSATEAKRPPVKTEVQIAYNGRSLSFPFKKTELVGALLRQAIEVFNVTQNPHLLSLFDDKGVELNENETLAKAKVNPGERLILRPSIVKGG